VERAVDPSRISVEADEVVVMVIDSEGRHHHHCKSGIPAVEEPSGRRRATSPRSRRTTWTTRRNVGAEEEMELASSEAAPVDGSETDSGAMPAPALWIALTLKKE